MKKNGNVKIYLLNSNKLIFEGEYLNGKKHGKAKEYNELGKLKFEGEYLNGKKSGKGKEYYYYFLLLFLLQLLLYFHSLNYLY